jgi:hypothetical protein
MRAQHRARDGGHAPALLLLMTDQRAQGPEVGAVALPADVAESQMGVVDVLLQILSPASIKREATLGADEKQTFAWLLHVVQRQPVCSAVECERQWSSKVESRKYSPHIVHPHRIRPAVVFLKTLSIYIA